jgi:hypothetical protein
VNREEEKKIQFGDAQSSVSSMMIVTMAVMLLYGGISTSTARSGTDIESKTGKIYLRPPICLQDSRTHPGHPPFHPTYPISRDIA